MEWSTKEERKRTEWKRCGVYVWSRCYSALLKGQQFGYVFVKCIPSLSLSVSVAGSLCVFNIRPDRVLHSSSCCLLVVQFFLSFFDCVCVSTSIFILWCRITCEIPSNEAGRLWSGTRWQTYYYLQLSQLLRSGMYYYRTCVNISPFLALPLTQPIHTSHTHTHTHTCRWEIRAHSSSLIPIWSRSSSSLRQYLIRRLHPWGIHSWEVCCRIIIIIIKHVYIFFIIKINYYWRFWLL